LLLRFGESAETVLSFAKSNVHNGVLSTENEDILKAIDSFWGHRTLKAELRGMFGNGEIVGVITDSSSVRRWLRRLFC